MNSDIVIRKVGTLIGLRSVEGGAVDGKDSTNLVEQDSRGLS